MEQRVLVLGSGLVGATLARDLARDEGFAVTVADRSEESLARLSADRVRTRRADLSDVAVLGSLAEEADLVVGALPSTLGFAALEAVVGRGRPYCDISFMVERGTDLDGLARERGVPAVIDCGVAPGLANMIVGRAADELDEVHDVVYYVGGLPRRRTWPFEYRAPFAPADVLEEYVRPARLVENGEIVERPALGGRELVDFPEVGTLEAFDTDGLRSLLHTIPARNMREKTLRYPGHAELMQVFRDTGFFDREPIAVAGTSVRPLDVTSALLFHAWRLEPGEHEFTLLQVEVTGTRAGSRERRVHRLFDETDPRTGEHSMARTTAFPCAAVARMLADGSFDRPGVHPPEVVGREPRLLARVLDDLRDRGLEVAEIEAGAGAGRRC